MSDLASLLKELEQVAKDTNLKEVKNEPLEESVASKDDVSSLFEGLEAAYTETKIEEEIANRLSEEDEQKLGAFSGFMESVTELTNQPNSQKAIEDLFATVAPPQPLIEIFDEPVIIEEVVEEPIEVEQADTIIQQIVSSLDDMGEKTEVKEQVDQISKLRDEFNNFRALMQQQVLSHTPGSGEVRLEFLDDVERSTAKVDGKFLKYSSSDSKWIGADASGSGSSAADDISAGDAAVTITTTSGDITIDAAANNSDIILKGTDGGSDTTFLTIDGSAAGKSTFNDEIVSGAVITSGAGLVIADDGNIGSVSDTDSIAIASDGVVTMDQIPVFSAGINVSGGTIAGTLATVAQGNVTSLGTLTALTVDDVAVNGKVITMTGSSSDTAVFTAGTNGTLSIVTTDDAAAAANIQITADGTVDIDSAGVLTLDSGAAINIEPASGSAILLDGTISVDAGVVTGATSITSTAFVGDITGDVTGNTSGTAATVTTAAQTNITSLGTLTALTVDDVVINGKVMTMTGSTDDTAVFTAGTHGTLSIVTTDDAAAAANITITADGTFEADGTTITLDSAGDIVLDAAGNNVTFKSAGTAILDISNSSSDAVITSSVQDKDIIFKGDDGGAAITALTLDMSAAGDAIFNNDIYVDKIRRASDSGTTTKILLNDEVLKLYAGHSSNEVVNIASGAVAVTGSVTASGIIKTDDTTAATSTTDGSLQTDGGLSVAADAVIGDDLLLLSDAAVLSFGANSEVTLTHVHNDGLLLNTDMQLQFRDSAINIRSDADGDLDINADDEIELNSTLVDLNANLDVSGTYTGGGLMTTGGNIVIPDAGEIGTASTTDAISILGTGEIGCGNTAYTGGQFYIYDNTTGRVGLRIVLDNASSAKTAIHATTDGTYFAAHFARSDTTTANPTVYSSNAAAGSAYQGASAGHTFYGTTTSASHAAFFGQASNTSHYALIGYSTHGLYATSLYCVGAMYKGSGTFRISHPLKSEIEGEPWDLAHSFIEGPQCDLIYSGRVTLVDGTASISMDTKYGMTQGTFEWLTKDVRTFTSNETGWDAVKSSFSGDTITIECQNTSSTDIISWMVVAERDDPNIKASEITDADGNLIIERPSEPTPPPPPEA